MSTWGDEKMGLGPQHLPDHDIKQNNSGNDAAFNVVVDGEGEYHRDDEDLQG